MIIVHDEHFLYSSEFLDYYYHYYLIFIWMIGRK